MGFTYPAFFDALLYYHNERRKLPCHQAAPYVKKSVPDFPDSVWKRPVFPCGRRLYPSIRHHHRRHNRSGPRICALVPHADHSVRTVLQCPDLFARAFVLGWKFAATTLLSTFFYPILLAFWQQFPALSSLTKDAMLCTILGGMMIGAGIGIVIRAGASTGGMDIRP